MRNLFLHIELLSNWLFMHVFNSVSEWIQGFLIRNYPFNHKALYLFDVLNVSNKVSVGYLFYVATSPIFAT